MSGRRSTALTGEAFGRLGGLVGLVARPRGRMAAGIAARLAAGLLWLAAGIGLAGCEAGQPGAAEQAAKAVPGELRDACKAVAERLVVLTQEALVRLPEQERALVDSQLGQVRDQYAATCMQEAWPAAVRQCMQGASTREAFAQCAPAPGR